MMKWDDLMELTDKRMNDPQVGDRFHEMYSYWVIVTAREGDALTTSEGAGGNYERPTVHYNSIGEFKKKFAYGSQPGYSVVYYDTPSTPGAA